tara:strand:+ start:18181 stop:18612 length:432 start_codon:yes stop_codon:yes gene_type:complete
VTPHFTLEELTASYTATRLEIDNMPTPEALANLEILANGLEAVREKLYSNPIKISSGYRCLKLNRTLKSRDTSYHVRGLAADFTCPAFGTVPEVMRALADSSIEFDQLILEFNSWIHIGFAEAIAKPRRQMMVIDKSGVKVYK